MSTREDPERNSLMIISLSFCSMSPCYMREGVMVGGREGGESGWDGGREGMEVRGGGRENSTKQWYHTTRTRTSQVSMSTPLNSDFQAAYAGCDWTF